MDELLNRNLALLRELDPAAAAAVQGAEPPAGARIESSRDGQSVLILDGISMNSRVAPWREAETWLRSSDVRAVLDRGGQPAVFGMALGYHVLAAAREVDGLTVIEPEAGIARLAFSLLDFRSALPRLKFIFGRPADAGYPTGGLLAHAPSVRRRRADWEYWAGSAMTAEAVRARSGPLTAGEIYILLIDELTGGGYSENQRLMEEP